MATIEMQVEVQAEIGIAPSEIGRVQSLRVDLRVEVADHLSDASALSGDISHTLDYGRLRDIVHQAFAETRFNLLEQVTTVIREHILAIEHVTGARVGVTKFHPWADVPSLTLTR